MTEQTIEAMAPCPFCGGAASIDCMGQNEWDVECYCGAGIIACGPNGDDKAKAIAAWNTRAQDPAAQARVEALEEALRDARLAVAADVEECEQSDSQTFLPAFKERLAKIDAALTHKDTA